MKGADPPKAAAAAVAAEGKGFLLSLRLLKSAGCLASSPAVEMLSYQTCTVSSQQLQ